MPNKKYKGNQDFNIDWDTFRFRLQSLMDRRGINKSTLARDTDLALSTICRYFLHNGTTPDITALYLLANYFDVEIDWLIGRSEERWKGLSPMQQKLADRYAILTPSDKLIIDTIIEKYGND